MSGEPERIRFCLACGEAMPYDERACSACGHAEPATAPAAPAAGGATLAACRACGEDIDVQRLFCPRCGVERRAGPVLAMPPDAPPEGSAGRLPMLAAIVTLLGPIVLLAAVLAAYARA